jgi:hypothetical protein
MSTARPTSWRGWATRSPWSVRAGSPATQRRRVRGTTAAVRCEVARLVLGAYRVPVAPEVNEAEGPDAVVRARGLALSVSSGANADAERSAQVSAYFVHQSIEDTLAEVQAAHRPVLGR